ncbi:MAG TPA: dTDP-4-dehydrorhamnose reductase [Candidatus Bathyarchaeia archaeon]|nr:dTDP-4-dehydrorhamnose reductase [Candidatus Bathyarchaeia archaeon]
MILNIKDARFLITGSAGQLGKEFQRVLSERHIGFLAPSEDAFDITNGLQIRAFIEKAAPDVIVNGAAYNAVDQAESDSGAAYAVNSAAVEHLARICKERESVFVHYSSDYVFDGKKGSPYVETDQPNPLNVYGASKLDGERRAREIAGNFLIFRLSWVYGQGQQNFFYKLRQWAKANNELNVSCDEISVPTYTGDVVELTLKALEAGLSGLYHLVNTGHVSRYELARYYFDKMGIKVKVNPVALETFGMPAKRPLFSAMSNEKLEEDLEVTIPAWQEALDRFMESA